MSHSSPDPLRPPRGSPPAARSSFQTVHGQAKVGRRLEAVGSRVRIQVAVDGVTLSGPTDSPSGEHDRIDVLFDGPAGALPPRSIHGRRVCRPIFLNWTNLDQLVAVIRAWEARQAEWADMYAMWSPTKRYLHLRVEKGRARVDFSRWWETASSDVGEQAVPTTQQAVVIPIPPKPPGGAFAVEARLQAPVPRSNRVVQVGEVWRMSPMSVVWAMRAGMDVRVWDLRRVFVPAADIGLLVEAASLRAMAATPVPTWGWERFLGLWKGQEVRLKFPNFAERFGGPYVMYSGRRESLRCASIDMLERMTLDDAIAVLENAERRRKSPPPPETPPRPAPPPTPPVSTRSYTMVCGDGPCEMIVHKPAASAPPIVTPSATASPASIDVPSTTSPATDPACPTTPSVSPSTSPPTGPASRSAAYREVDAWVRHFQNLVSTRDRAGRVLPSAPSARGVFLCPAPRATCGEGRTGCSVCGDAHVLVLEMATDGVHAGLPVFQLPKGAFETEELQFERARQEVDAHGTEWVRPLVRKRSQ